MLIVGPKGDSANNSDNYQKNLRRPLFLPMLGEPEAANPPVRFAERGVETEQAWILRHRQPKGPAHTHGQPNPPRHTSTLPEFPLRTHAFPLVAVVFGMLRDYDFPARFARPWFLEINARMAP